VREPQPKIMVLLNRNVGPLSDKFVEVNQRSLTRGFFKKDNQYCFIVGVQFIHANRWLHLDLKPFNIVFSKKRDDYDLRIIDFGLARELGESSSIKVKMCG